MRREIRRWRKMGGEGKEYKEKRKEYRELCERKKKEENEKWEKCARKAKKESDVWGIINRKKVRRVRINKRIEMEKWKEYFMGMLEGVEGRVMGKERRKEEEEDEKEEMSREKIRDSIKTLKDGKAKGTDEIPEEAWRYGGKKVKECIWKISNDVWKERGWPDGKRV